MFEGMDRNSKRKQELIAIIVELMDEDGLKNVTVKDICDATGISTGTFYHYFKSKDAIVDEMFKLMDEYFIFSESEIRSHLTCKDKIIDFVKHFGLYVEMWGYYANVLIMNSHISKCNYNKDRQLYSILRNLIEEGRRNSEIRMEEDKLQVMIFVIMRGHLLEWVNSGEDYPVRDNMVEQTRYFLDGLEL